VIFVSRGSGEWCRSTRRFNGEIILDVPAFLEGRTTWTVDFVVDRDGSRYSTGSGSSSGGVDVGRRGGSDAFSGDVLRIRPGARESIVGATWWTGARA